METKIRLRPSELNEKLINKILQYIGDHDNIDIVISLTDSQKSYNELLNQSIKSAQNEEHLIDFTMEDFLAYTPESKTGK